MSALNEYLKQAKPRERLVQVDGHEFLVIGFGRVAKNELRGQFTAEDGKVDTNKLEAELLRECVYDPATRERVEFPGVDADIPGHISGPLVAAVMWACGYDADDVGRTEKN